MGSTSRNKKKVDQYGFTMHAKEESEEDEENLKKEDSNNSNTEEEEMEGGSGRGRESVGRIVQTRSVTVTVAYEDQVGESGGGTTTAATRGAAV